MRNTYGGQINRKYIPSTNITDSFSGVWNIQEHYELRREGKMGYGLKYHPTTVLHIGGGYETNGDTNIVDLTGNCDIINNFNAKNDDLNFFTSSVDITQGIYYSSDQVKYGNCSIRSNKLSNIIILYNELLNIELTDFTFEWWEYRETSQSAATFLRWEQLASGYCTIIGGYYNPTGNALRYYMASGISSWNINAASLGTGSFNNWNHYAICRNRTTGRVYAFQNGTLTSDTGLLAITTLTFHSASLILPAQYPTTNEQVTYVGYFQDFCLSRRAKYSSSFTPGPITE